jgi:hypothetical protein
VPPAKKLDFHVGIMTIYAEFLAERTIRQDGGRLTRKYLTFAIEPKGSPTLKG